MGSMNSQFDALPETTQAEKNAKISLMMHERVRKLRQIQSYPGDPDKTFLFHEAAPKAASMGYMHSLTELTANSLQTSL
jgi:hypothetical protein